MALFEKFRSGKIIFLHDLLMIPIAWFGAYWLRFNLGEIPETELSVAWRYLFVVVFVQALIFRIFGLYRGVWRFASIPDLLRISKAIMTGALIIFVVLFLVQRLSGVPRSVLPLYVVLLMLLLGTPRLVYRCWKDNCHGQALGKRAIIVGAGLAGEMLVRDLLREQDSAFCPIAFVDDDARKKKREIHGLRVLGASRKLPKLVEELRAEIVLIAIPSAGDLEMRRIVALCEASNVPFLTLPSVKDILAGRVTQKELRDVAIEDLLGRDPVKMDWESIQTNLRSARVLITGGGGSIGSELCKQIAKLSVRRLIIFEKSEFGLYQIQAYLSRHAPESEWVGVLGDVADEAAVDHVIKQYKPDYVFHAAAYKHVPLLQNQVCEAIKNNVLGTEIVAQAAIDHRVENFVLISTDKAVNPTSVMGASKRVAEMLCRCLHYHSRTKFFTVRFGNVLDSAGSVVPLFRDQIRRGGPVTVTDPDITRFFMTIPEACQLILKAATVGLGGEVFVLDMGEPIKIRYLAEQMIRLSGKRPYEDIKIVYTGLQKGEKMYEELFGKHEECEKTEHSKLLLARWNFSDTSAMKRNLEALKKACIAFDEDQVLSELIQMVPEYSDAEGRTGDVVYPDPPSKIPAGNVS